MPRPGRLLRLPLAGLLLVTSAALALEDERWYRVELMIFTPPGGANSETWQAQPELAYPDTLRYLIPRDELPVVEITDAGEQSVLDVETDMDETTQLPADGMPPEPVASEPEPPRPTPFALLPRSALEFAAKASYMERVDGHRILFHESWVQPLAPDAPGPALVMDQMGSGVDWPELQGTVTLSLSRYLHLEANLWRNTRGDYLPAAWQMPPPPRLPDPADEAQPDASATPQESATPAPQTPLPATGDFAGALPPEEEGLQGAEDAYPWRHAVLMRQKRRMRSDEVHYLDHPMLGIVAKLVPLDDEALEALAAEEQALAGTVPGDASAGQ
ncbi:MAG: CsiV family protein [Halioglobus sp.]|nr:CsiV family protein [Halioglobus sp.]